MTAPDTDLRRIALVAAQVGISKPTLYRAAKRGVIQLHHLGRMTFVSVAEVQGWIAKNGNREGAK
jgi:excisionase family DNA binding protein